ncbi:MAG TPA: hypothetical protein VI565_09140, partial [Burkholderiales bacterium]|nr:hypothetical protein [Burkholderiales bacterium]
KSVQNTARISPDGKWIAYRSSESGRDEVYLKPFPSLDARFQVSLAGGLQPVWSPDGRRLYYLSLDARMLSATLAFSPFAVAQRDTILTNVSYAGGPFSDNHANFDVAPDDKTFVFLRGREQPESRVIFVHDWKYELRERMKRGGK